MSTQNSSGSHHPLVYDQAEETFSSWIFDSPSATKTGGRVVYIHDGTKIKKDGTVCSGPHPRIQLCKDDDPRLVCPFGLGGIYDNNQRDSGETSSTNTFCGSRVTLDLSVTHEPLLKFLHAFDALIQEVAYSKCKEWFDKELSREQIARMYRPCLTQRSDAYPATIRTKVALKGSMSKCKPISIWKVIEVKGDKLRYGPGSSEIITRGAEVWATVDVTSMYFMSTMFGCTLSVSDLLVFPSRHSFPFLTSMSLVEYKGTEDDDTSDNQEHSNLQPRTNKQSKKKSASASFA